MGKLELVIETDKISIYSPHYDGEEKTEFEKFLIVNGNCTNPQLKSFFGAIVSAIDKMEECGARENLFRPEGGNVVAVPLSISYPRIDRKVGKMRLFCLRISDRLLIIGNGGVSIHGKYDDDPSLLQFVKDLREIDKHIKIHAKDAETGYDDFDAIKMIIESITL
jgi:hypothetical protein